VFSFCINVSQASLKKLAKNKKQVILPQDVSRYSQHGFDFAESLLYNLKIVKLIFWSKNL